MDFNLNQALKDIGEKLGMPDLEPNEEGRWELLSDNFAVYLEWAPETGSVFVYSLIGRMPEDPPVELQNALLQANFFTRETAGCTIGVDPFSDSIALFVRWSMSELATENFEERLLDFFEATDIWIRRIQGWLGEAPDASPDEGAQPITAPFNMTALRG